jgi:hypothetical protein
MSSHYNYNDGKCGSISNKETEKSVARMPGNKDDDDKDDDKAIKQGNTYEEGNKKIPAKDKINDKGNENKNEEKIERNEKKSEEKKNEKKNETTFEEIYREQEGPHPELESGHASELGYDGFYLGMTWYLWNMLPDLGIDLEPVDPTGEWEFVNYYDKPMGWQSKSIAYSRDLCK